MALTEGCCPRDSGEVCVPCACCGIDRAGVGVPATYWPCWSTIFVAESDSHVNVNCELGADKLMSILVVDESKLTFSRPLVAGVNGPCSAAVLMAWEMIPPVFSMPGVVTSAISSQSKKYTWCTRVMGQ